ncbi:MAG: hypothetical protein ABIN80_12790 [Dyadobacter sp.]|uniref:hypothetical protein n=1 Tax=Dyadobacter sp. TaxID=1914288 RepID=UPI0032678DBD
MKIDKLMLTSCALIALFASCKEDPLDSPFITISTPTINQTIESKDSVRISAIIEPRNTSVLEYTVSVKGAKNASIYESHRSCDCGGINVVNIQRSFVYDPKKTTDLILEIRAKLESGAEIRETVSFTLTK